MAEVRSRNGIVKNGLIRSMNTEYISKYVSCFSGRNAKRNMESKNKTEGVERVSDIRNR